MTTTATVYACEGTAYTDSRNVADVFGKGNSVIILAFDVLREGLNRNVDTSGSSSATSGTLRTGSAPAAGRRTPRSDYPLHHNGRWRSLPVQ